MQKTTVISDIVTAPTGAKAVGRKKEIFDRALFWSFLGALAWCPFWFGSNDLTAWGVNAILFPGLALAYEASVLLAGRRHPVNIKTLGLPVVLFAVVVGWVVVQSGTWVPPGLAHPIWALAADTLGQPVDASISVNRDQTSLALLRLVTAASVFWVALQMCRDSARSRQLINAVAAIVCFYAAFGLISAALMPDNILWIQNFNPHGSVSATFINRNSFATFAGMGFLAISTILLRLYRHATIHAAGPPRMRIAMFIETTGRVGAAVIAATFIIAGAELLSGSRGAILSTAVAFFVLIVLTFKRDARRANEQRETILFVIFLAAAAFVAFGDQFMGKLANGDLDQQGRMAVYGITIESILDSPMLGYGYGTFSDIFPMFRDQSISVIGHWLQAHNTYLELFQGLGVFFGFLLIACVATLVFRCLKGAMVRIENASVPALAASAGVLVGLHALVDFSLQIQAVTLTFMALLGAGCAQSASSRMSLGD